MEQSQEEPLLHVSVSNQSLSQTIAELVISLDGEQIFRREMRTGTQHTWEETMIPVVRGRHTLVISEARTKSRKEQEINLDRELWIIVMFYSPPPRIQVEILDRPVGFM